MKKKYYSKITTTLNDQIKEAEHAIGLALTATAKLIKSSNDLKIESRLPLHCGADIMQNMTDVAETLFKGREQINDLKIEFSEIMDIVRLGVVYLVETNDRQPPVNVNQFQSRNLPET